MALYYGSVFLIIINIGTEPSLQLFVGLDNGLVYQHDISSPDKPPILISNNSTSAVIDTHVFDIQGVLQTTAKAEAPPSDPEPKEQEGQAMESHPSTSTTSPEEESLAAGRKSHESGASLSKDEDGASSKSEKSSGSMGLLRRTTRKLSKSSARANKEPPPPPPPLPTEDASPPSASTVESQSAESTTQHTKRAPHASKWEYRPQPHPHFIVVSTSRNVATILSGYNIRLFTAHLHDIDGCSNEDMIIHSQVMVVKNGKNQHCYENKEHMAKYISSSSGCMPCCSTTEWCHYLLFSASSPSYCPDQFTRGVGC